MKRIILAAALAAALPAAAEPETFSIDPSHTLPAFEVRHFGMSTQRGQFTRASGKVIVDRAAKTGSADITIDMGSVQTAVAKLAEHLRGADFFEVEKFPTATFKGSDFRFEGDRLAAVSGDLTLKGVTKPVTLRMESFLCASHPMNKKVWCGGDATTTIKRSDFGVKAFLPAVGDEVKLSIPVEAFKD